MQSPLARSLPGTTATSPKALRPEGNAVTNLAQSSRRSQFVTGATGFVGAALVLEILDRTTDPVLCVVRKKARGQSPRSRLLTALVDTANGSGRPDLADRLDPRCSVVEGDLLFPRAGIDSSSLGTVSDFWHCAASLKFSQDDRDEIFEHNVEGTKHAIELAKSLDCKIFNYISTAYVAGSSEGLIAESPAASKSSLNNCYEESKLEAEQIVAESGLPFRIIRPSIVLGYSSTRWSSSESGFYGYLKNIAQLNRFLESERKRSILRELTVPGNPDARLNLVPVDLVASQALRISMSQSSARYFHVCSGTSPTLGEMQRHIMPKIGFAGPWISRDANRGAHPTYDQLIDNGLAFYKSYLIGVKEFSRANTLAAIGEDETTEPITLEELSHYAHRFLMDRRLLPSNQAALLTDRPNPPPQSAWRAPD